MMESVYTKHVLLELLRVLSPDQRLYGLANQLSPHNS